MGKNAGLSLSSTGWLPSKPSWLQELDVARGRQRIGRPALSTPHATGRQTTTARTTGRRTLFVPPRAGRQPLLPATDVGRGKPRLLLTLLPLPQDPALSTLPSLPSTLLHLPQDQPRSTMPSPASILLGLHPAPPLSTLHRPNSTSSRRRLTSLPGVDFFLSPRFYFELERPETREINSC